MKKIIAITATSAIIAASTFPATAQNALAELCPAIGQLAAAIMTQRQSGASMSELMNTANNLNAVEAVKELSRNTIIEAFGHPQYETQSYREQAVQEFRNKAELACYSVN